jgi:hypothetical protein
MRYRSRRRRSYSRVRRTGRRRTLGRRGRRVFVIGQRM